MFRSYRRSMNRSRPEDVGVTPDIPVNWRRLVGYLKPYRGRMVIAILSLIASAALSLVFPVVIKHVVDSVLAAGDITLLDRITLLLVLVFLLRALSSAVESYTLNQVGERITFDLRLQLYRRLQALSLDFFEHRRVGELISRLSSDVTVVRESLTRNFGVFLQQSLTLAGAIVVMLVLNWRLTLFILALAPVVVGVGFVFGVLLRRTSTAVQDELARATVVAEEVFQNIRIVKTFVREPYENQRYSQAVDEAFRAALRRVRIRAIFAPLIAFLGFTSLALILWFGGREVLAGRITGGDLIAFLIYGLTVASSIGSLVGLYAALQEALGASKRVFELLDQIPTVQDRPHARPVPPVEGRITFDNVSFSYETGAQVLHDIDLDIAPGEILALVGPSGAGKSTIFNLIPRFYDPTHGSVRLDGVDLRDLQQDSLRRHIGIVPQETLLFGGTVLENILYGRLDATHDEVVQAAIAANAHDFILALPQGYETIVGERGVRLSGGQRQRVAIARALLKDPRILLLDEATSSLDSESERLVQEALERLMQGRTTVIIAHRLSTIRVAHRIAVLDQGRVVEVGAHEELMASQGLYQKLYEMQFREDLFIPATEARRP